MTNSIEAQLKKLKLKRVSILGDGNCQYRALAYALSHLEKDTGSPDHKFLRQLAASLIVLNKERYEEFIWDISFKQYIEGVKKKAYGDEITMTVLAKYFNTRVVVLRNMRRRNIINPSGKYKITLIYTGDDGDDAHYDATTVATTVARRQIIKKKQKQKKSGGKKVKCVDVKEREKSPKKTKRKR